MSRTFQLVAGHPVLDFVNTLDNRFTEAGPLELLARPADLSDFVRQSGLADAGLDTRRVGARSGPAATHALRSARELREALAGWLYAADDGAPAPLRALATMERFFLDAGRHRALAASPGVDGALRVGWTRRPFAGHPLLPVWLIAGAAESLLTSEDANRIHQCRSTSCRWLFLDLSRNHSRRWCDMKICGNRMKVRRFQRRLRPATSPDGSPAPSTGSPPRS